MRMLFSKTCRLSNLKLNRAKVKQHQSSVKFMGHLVTSQGLRPEPEKIQAILQMLEPDYVIALKRFLGIEFLSRKDYASPIRDDRATQKPGRQEGGVQVVATMLVMNIIKKFQTEEPAHRNLSPRCLFKQTEKWKML